MLFFLVTLDVMVVAEETIEAVVLLEEVFADCSERTAFLASGNEIPRSTFICCTFFPTTIWDTLVRRQSGHLCN